MYGQSWEEALSSLQESLGYSFNDLDLLREAMTHSSYANETGLPFYNERLEYLGDAVLELVSSTKLFKENPCLDEGTLTKLRSQLVCSDALYKWSQYIEITKCLRVNKGVRKDSASKKLMSVFSDAVEALFGAVYIDGGFEAASLLIFKYLDFHYILNAGGDHFKPGDPKSQLQIFYQEKGDVVPTYKMLERNGPSHCPEFQVGLYLEDRLLCCGTGTSIKKAEFKAAAKALELCK